MAKYPGFAMLLCPATIAIHDYGDVAGQLVQIYFRFNIHYLILGAYGFSGWKKDTSGKNSDKIKKKKRKMNSWGIFESRIINFVCQFLTTLSKNQLISEVKRGLDHTTVPT